MGCQQYHVSRIARLGGQTEAEARAHYDRFIAPYFTTDGRADLAVRAAGIAAIAAELGVPETVTAEQFYRSGHH